MNKKKIISVAMLVIGILPFFAALIFGIFHAIHGAGTFTEGTIYGLEAFQWSALVLSSLIWPAYLVGFVLVFIAVIRLIYEK